MSITSIRVDAFNRVPIPRPLTTGGARRASPWMGAALALLGLLMLSPFLLNLALPVLCRTVGLPIQAHIVTGEINRPTGGGSRQSYDFKFTYDYGGATYTGYQFLPLSVYSNQPPAVVPGRCLVVGSPVFATLDLANDSTPGLGVIGSIGSLLMGGLAVYIGLSIVFQKFSGPWLMRYGRAAEARVREVRPDDTAVLQFEAEGRPCILTTAWTGAEIGETTCVIYDPARPERNMLYDRSPYDVVGVS